MKFWNQERGWSEISALVCVACVVSLASATLPAPLFSSHPDTLPLPRFATPCPVRGKSCPCGCVSGNPCRCAVAAPSPAPIVVASPSRPIVHTSTILPPVSYTVAPVLSYPQPVQVAPPVQYAPAYPSTPQYTPAYFGSSGFGGGYCAGGG